MALGDGIRRNIAHVSQEERDRFIAAILQMDLSYYADGVSKWDKQDDIHQATHVHGGASFLPWHRELCNRFEQHLREIDFELSLHYWDWTTDPRQTPDGQGGFVNLFTNIFMGGSAGAAGDPLNPLMPPNITRDIAGGAAAPSPPAIQSDINLITSADALPDNQQFQTFRTALEGNHNTVHGYIGGNIGAGHSAFEDPFVFLLHSNVDRIWAMWQSQLGQEWRLDPDLTYGDESDSVRITETLEPWDGGSGLRPWAPPENDIEVKNSKHPSVVKPPCYDTLPSLTTIELTNPTGTIDFNDVPEGETTARAAVFNVQSCVDGQIRIKAGNGPAAPFNILSPGSSVAIIAGSNEPVRFWFGFTGTVAGTSEPDQNVILECPQTGEEFPITLSANTITRVSIGSVLVLDQSGSMNSAAGSTGNTRIEALREAGARFVELVQAGNGVGVVRFDHDAYPVNHATYPGFPVTTIATDSDLDANRIAARNAVNTHTVNLLGYTSIGDGVVMGRSVLNALADGIYTNKAIIVFTDGLENSPAYLADITDEIDERTYAIGLGNESQVSTSALNLLTNSTDGYLLVTGNLDSSIDAYFRLSKYFLQILAGVNNNEIIVDPSGVISAGATITIPVSVTEAENQLTVILLTDGPGATVIIKTPTGLVINPANVAGLGGQYGTGTNMQYYRFNLPVALGAGEHTGTWHAVIQNTGKIPSPDATHARSHSHQATKDRIRYSLLVQARSALHMTTRLSQNSLLPGNTLYLNTVLDQYSIPLANRASITAQLTLPDRTVTTVQLVETAPGKFETSATAALNGTYHCLIKARGLTLGGHKFTREFLQTGTAFMNGDAPLPSSNNSPARFTSLLQRCCFWMRGISLFVVILLILIVIILLN